MRTATAWVLGIATFFALMAAFTALGNLVGVPVQILFDEPVIISNRYYEEERDSSFTSFGICAIIISIMIASRVGMAVVEQAWHGGLIYEQETQFRAWFIGLAVLGCFGAILYLAFRDFHGGISGIIFNVIEIGAAAGIGWAMKTWHDLRVQRHRAIQREIEKHGGGSE
jgi:hypothetical protein